MASTADKAKAFGKGAATGGAMTGAVMVAMKGAANVAKTVAPRAAAVVGGVVSLPVIAGATVVGAAYGAGKAAKQGKSGVEIAYGGLAGASSMGLNVVKDVVIGTKDTITTTYTKTRAEQGIVSTLGPVLTEKQEAAAAVHNDTESVRAVIGKQIKDAEARMAREGKTGKGAAWKAANEERSRAIAALGELDKGRNEQLSRINNGGKPAAKVEDPADDRGLFGRAKDALFGKPGPAKPPKEDAVEKQRKTLENDVAALRKEMSDEASKGGRGPRYDKITSSLEAKQKELGDVAKAQAAKEKAEVDQWYQLGALGAGAIIGFGAGAMTYKAAKKAAAASAAGVEKLARSATATLKSNPKGVIAGTVAGDKAAAAVVASKAAVTAPVVSVAAAYGLPAINVAQGATAYGISKAMGPDNPTAKYYQLEGIGAMSAGAFGLKGAIAARALRTTVSPQATAQLQALNNRLTRERRTKAPGAVAQTNARVAAQSARTTAAVKGIEGQARVGAAAHRAQATVAGAKAKAPYSVEVSRHQGKQAAIQAGRGTALAKVRSEKAVARAQGDKPIYKDTWTDSRGRHYTRKDKSIRTANDNGKAA